MIMRLDQSFNFRDRSGARPCYDLVASIETGARNKKLKVYEMIDHPVARALTGYLLVRGGGHQVAYARAVENLTGSDMMKLFPSPPDDFKQLAAVFNGPHPETGEELEGQANVDTMVALLR